MTDQNGNPPQAPCCANCPHSYVAKGGPANIGQSVRQCRFNPPYVVTIVTPQGNQITTQFPCVADSCFCFQHPNLILTRKEIHDGGQ